MDVGGKSAQGIGGCCSTQISGLKSPPIAMDRLGLHVPNLY